MRSILSTLSLLQISHHTLNSTNLNPPLLTESKTSISAHHTIIPNNLRHTLNNLPILHKLRNNSSRCLPSKATELHRSLSVSLAFAHATRTRLEGNDMARTTEGVNSGIWRGKSTAGKCAILSRNTSCHGVIA